MDPLTAEYPFYSPYQFAGNTPIWAVDLDGLEPRISTEYSDHVPAPYIQLTDERIVNNRLNGTMEAGVGLFRSYFMRLETYLNGTQPNIVSIPVSMAYSIPNNLSKLMTGHTLGGWQVSNDDAAAAGQELLIEGLAFGYGRYLKKASNGLVAPKSVGAMGSKGSKIPLQEKKIIGLGLDENLVNHRGSGALTYKRANWQQNGLTDVDWGKASFDDYSFKESFRQAAGNADEIRFDVTDFNPLNTNRKMTKYEFNEIIGDKALLDKTTFIRDGVEKNWNGTEFVDF